MILCVWITVSRDFMSWSICTASSSQTNRDAGDRTGEQQRIPEFKGHLGEEQHPHGAPAQRELQQAHPQFHPGWRNRSDGGHHRRGSICWPRTKDCTGTMPALTHTLYLRQCCLLFLHANKEDGVHPQVPLTRRKGLFSQRAKMTMLQRGGQSVGKYEKRACVHTHKPNIKILAFSYLFSNLMQILSFKCAYLLCQKIFKNNIIINVHINFMKVLIWLYSLVHTCFRTH